MVTTLFVFIINERFVARSFPRLFLLIVHVELNVRECFLSVS